MTRVLLDECVPCQLCGLLVGFHCRTVPQADLAGKKNGQLLALAESAGFHVLLTLDRGMQHQQNLSGRTISILVIRSKSSDIDDLRVNIPACLAALYSIKPGQVMHVPSKA